MEEKTPFSAIEFNILPLADEDKAAIQAFSCGCQELDDFFHHEVFLCARYGYVAAFCAKNNKGEIIALFTLANDAIVLSSTYEKQDFVEATFSSYQAAGCQFITVDSLNNPRTNKFYMSNGFQLQTNSDAHLPTRRMYLPVNLY